MGVMTTTIHARAYSPSQPEFWIRKAAETFFVNVDDLLARSHAGGPKEIRQYRQAAMWVARMMTEMSYPELALAFNKDDHTTVMNAVRRAETDDRIMCLVEEIFEYVEAEGE